LKETNQALGVEMIMKLAEVTPSSLLSLGAQSVSGPINSIVTNIPGPQVPLYLQGAKLISLFPQVPLLGDMGLGIALMSYNGKICWGFNANPDVIPDLEAFVSLIRTTIDRVADAAGVSLSDSKPRLQTQNKKRGRTSRSKATAGTTPAEIDEVILPSGDRVEPTSA
jgi:hypothetical protein